MKERILKVYESTGTKNLTPRIQLQGKWLENIGFHIGEHFTVSYDQNQIIIKLQSKETTSS